MNTKQRLINRDPASETHVPPVRHEGTGADEKLRARKALREGPRAIVALLLFTALSSCQDAFAQSAVSMKNGSYNSSWIDIDEKGKEDGLRLLRTYSSRSVQVGAFGFGWCSSFESKLLLSTKAVAKVDSDQKKIYLRDCGLESDIQFFKNENFNPDVKGVESYASHDPSIGELTFDGKVYRLQSIDGRLRTFDTKGKLLQSKQNSRASLNFTYDLKGRLTEVRAESGISFFFEYEDATLSRDLVRKVRSSSGKTAVYSYDDRNLIKVRNSWGSEFTHTYDTFQNLVRTDYPDRTNQIIQYDEKRDLVKSFQGRDTCLETYHFIVREKDPALGHTSIAQKKCKNQKAITVKMEFINQFTPKKTRYLASVIVERNGKMIKRTNLHPLTGQKFSQSPRSQR